MGQRRFTKFALAAILISTVIAVNCNRTGITNSSGAPEVIFTNPENNAEEVPLDATLTVTFSEAMDTTTFNTNSFNLKLDSFPVPGIVTFTETSATFIPLNNLSPKAAYVATITTDVRDALGFRMQENYVWRFSTIDATGAVNVEVVSTNPPDDAENISLSPRITVHFSEEMNPATLNEETFILRRGTTSIPGSVSASDSSAVFIPSRSLSFGSTYTATITTGAESVTGRSLAANYNWSFTTVENTDNDAPEISSVKPGNDADDVAVNTTISATFDEQINPSTLNTATFILRRGRENIEGSVEYSGTTATFIPDENLEFDERYTARITDEVEDLAGNNLGRNFDWRFSTQDDSDDNAPEIVDVEPDDGADDVGVNTTISVTFSEAMNPVSINGFTFQVMEDGPGNSTRSVVGFIDYSGFTATFTPFSSLNADERYFIVVTGEVEDDAGNEMNEDFEWDFRTRDNDDDDDDDD